MSLSLLAVFVGLVYGLYILYHCYVASMMLSFVLSEDSRWLPAVHVWQPALVVLLLINGIAVMLPYHLFVRSDAAILTFSIVSVALGLVFNRWDKIGGRIGLPLRLALVGLLGLTLLVNLVVFASYFPLLKG